MLLSAISVPVYAEGASRDSASEKAAFLSALNANGYAEVGGYKVKKIKDNVYCMDEATKSLPGGAKDADGNMNNPSSIYFVESDNDVLVVDLGNPAAGEKETDVKIIFEAMTGSKNVTIAITHGHGDHTGLGRSEAVFENVKVDAVYMGAEDIASAVDALKQFSDKGRIHALNDGDSFTVGKDTYLVDVVPAHTDGSLMIQDKKHNTLFTGDTFGSGALWLFWKTNNGNPIAALSAGVKKAQELLNGMDANPSILAGHRWQQFWDQNPQRPGEMTIQYFNDMQQVITGLADGTTVRSDYSSVWKGSIELSSNGAKAKIDTLPSLVDTYLNQRNAMKKAYVYSASDKLSITSENATAPATFVIYPNGYLSDADAKKYLDDTGITDIVDRSASTAYIARPANGKSFTAEDVAGFKAIVGKITVCDNFKLVGIGNDASFINQNLTKYMNFVSGLALIGGNKGEVPVTCVPAYVSGADAASYISANKAEQTSIDGTMTTFVNPGNRFALVVTNSAGEDAVNGFKNAWKTVLNKFGRIGNYTDADKVGTW